jgi:hypothetical protein
VVASVLWKIGTVPTTDDEKNLGGPKGDTTKLGPKTQARFALHAFRQSGGIQAVVNVMDTFPDSAKLRKRASSIFVQLLVIEDAGGHNLSLAPSRIRTKTRTTHTSMGKIVPSRDNCCSNSGWSQHGRQQLKLCS